jgi:amino acid transporter
MLPITVTIIVLLSIVCFSYRQTIPAYPKGGGSYTVASDNLGTRLGLLAGAALIVDYILNVAVGISAGVGAIVSALSSLYPHTVISRIRSSFADDGWSFPSASASFRCLLAYC